MMNGLHDYFDSVTARVAMKVMSHMTGDRCDLLCIFSAFRPIWRIVRRDPSGINVSLP
jgi:hypothetical protein